MDQIVLVAGVTFLVFGLGLTFFLITNYYRRLTAKRDLQLKELTDAGDAAGAEAMEQEILLLRVLVPRYARKLRNYGLGLLALYFLFRMIL